MRHPQDRLDRRAVREYYIQRRREFILSTQKYAKEYHEGLVHEGSSHYQWDSYWRWVRWQEMSEDDKKIAEVEAVLDGKEAYEAKPSWEPTQWGKYAKYNLACSCWACQYGSKGEHKERRARRAKIKKLKLCGFCDEEYKLGCV